MEAFRVLKPNSIAAFTVWGRRENCLIFTALEAGKRRLAAKMGLPFEEPTLPSNFDFGRDIEQNMAIFREAGFAQVKHWFQPSNHLFRNTEEFFAFPVARSFKTLEPAL